jgi:hypothetical protein
MKIENNNKLVLEEDPIVLLYGKWPKVVESIYSTNNIKEVEYRGQSIKVERGKTTLIDIQNLIERELYC